MSPFWDIFYFKYLWDIQFKMLTRPLEMWAWRPGERIGWTNRSENHLYSNSHWIHESWWHHQGTQESEMFSDSAKLRKLIITRVEFQTGSPCTKATAFTTMPWNNWKLNALEWYSLCWDRDLKYKPNFKRARKKILCCASNP